MIKLDKQIFLFINQTLANSVFDWIMPLWREATIWIPLYILVLYFAIKQYKKSVWFWFVFAALTVFCTDQLSAHIIKPLVQRPRPYCDVEFSSQVRLLLSNINRGFSFVSSHATNHFGIALFFVSTLAVANKYKYWLITWAALVCFAQVYVGVHYPIDVFCGSLLGVLVGKSVAFGYKKLSPKVFGNY